MQNNGDLAGERHLGALGPAALGQPGSDGRTRRPDGGAATAGLRNPMNGRNGKAPAPISSFRLFMTERIVRGCTCWRNKSYGV